MILEDIISSKFSRKYVKLWFVKFMWKNECERVGIIVGKQKGLQECMSLDFST